MTIRRYVAATVREAMRDVRRDLGEEAMILSNKRVGGRVEILAAAPDAVEALVERRAAARRSNAGAAPVAAESFQEFIRRQSQLRPAAASPDGPRPTAPATLRRVDAPARGAQMYSAVAAELPDDSAADDGARATAQQRHMNDDLPMPRAATNANDFEATARSTKAMPAPMTPAFFPHGGTAAFQASRHDVDVDATVARQPQFETHLPAAPAARPAAAAPASATREAQPAPAVFRRRPARSAAPAANAGPTPAPEAPPQPPATTAIPTPPVAPVAAASSPAVDTTPAAQPSALRPGGAAPCAQPTAMAAAPVAAAASAPFNGVPAATAAVAPRAATVTGPGAVTAAPPATQPAASALAVPAADAPQAVAPAADPRLVAELQAMRALLQDQLVSLATTVAAADALRRHPLRVKLMTRLLTAGFSPELARCVVSNAPADVDGERAEAWLHDVIALNLKCVAEHDGIVERGGVYALVGPTGVGKTTTVAKLAARYAVRHGAATLGLITLDAYRIGAHEQLRTYGRILGVPVQLAQDGATLRELLASMYGKRLVLIDTCGISQRDERLPEMMNALAAAGSPARPIARVLLVNAASHAETVDDVARAWRAHAAAGAILTKLDEAARIGGALDALLRYKLALFGLTNGQRVPEDWHLANGRLLAHLSLKPAARLFALEENEGALLAQTAAAAAGAAHA